MKNVSFRFGMHQDLPQIKELLQSCLLPYEDIDDHVQNFILAIDNNKIVGSLGIENYGNYGLLRSFAVSYDYRDTHIIKTLFTKMEDYAKDKQVKKVYLLTNTIEGFLSKIGFDKIDRTEVPGEISATKEFVSKCCSSAKCMTKNV